MCGAQSLPTTSSLCPTLYDPTDHSPPGSSVQGILWARVLEWVAISFSSGSSNPGLKLESPESPALQADSLPLESLGMPNERNDYHHVILPILLVSLSAFLKSSRELGQSRGQDSGGCFSLSCPKKTTLGDEGPTPLLSLSKLSKPEPHLCNATHWLSQGQGLTGKRSKRLTFWSLSGIRWSRELCF